MSETACPSNQSSSYSRREFIRRTSYGMGSALAAGSVFSGPSKAGSSSRPPSDPPNIVMIASDDQGYVDLGCCGGEVIQTPNLDRLADEGVRLASYYMSSPACTPARGSLLTGRYPQRNGTYELFRNKAADYGHEYTEEGYATTPERILGMDTREVLISDVLEEAGYTNGIFGKWDLGQLQRFLPLQRGFHDFYGFVNTGIDYYTHERYGIHSMYRNNEPTKEDQGTYATYLFEREADRFLQENHDNEPFFLYVPFNAPHFASNLDDSDPPVPAPQKYIDQYPDQDPEDERTQYMAAVTCMDDAIGTLLDRLDEYGLTENTIVIFMSDHGGGALADNGPLRQNKGEVFEGGIRAPCIVRWPGEIPAGTVNDEFLTALEFFPTLVEATGASYPDGVVLDGFDMMDVLRGDQSSLRNEMFWEFRDERAARLQNWKWVDSSEGSGLFNLAEDLGEENDLSELRPKKLVEVKTAFDRWRAEMDRVAEIEPRRPFMNF